MAVGSTCAVSACWPRRAPRQAAAWLPPTRERVVWITGGQGAGDLEQEAEGASAPGPAFFQVAQAGVDFLQRFCRVEDERDEFLHLGSVESAGEHAFDQGPQPAGSVVDDVAQLD